MELYNNVSFKVSTLVTRSFSTSVYSATSLFERQARKAKGAGKEKVNLIEWKTIL